MAVDLHNYRVTAAARGWGAGWPSCQGVRTAGTAVVRADRSGVGVSVHRRIARLVDLLLDETERRGYLLRANECGGYNCRAIANTSTPSNHSWGLACFAGATEVLTRDGVATLSELAGTDAVLLTRDPLEGRSGRWVTAPVRSFGLQPTMRLTIGRRAQQRTIEVTPDHRWYVYRQRSEPRGDRAGQRRPRWRVFETTTDQLRVGERLVMCLPAPLTRREAPSSIGVAHGIVYGDGTLSRTAGATVDLIGPKNAELLRYFPQPAVNALADTPGGQTVLRVSLLPRYFKQLPSLDESSQYLMGFLAGWFAADGSVDADRGSPTLKCADREALEWAEIACLRLGIGTTPIRMVKRDNDPGAYGPRPVYTLRLMRQTLGEGLFVRADHRKRFVEAPLADDLTAWTVRAVEPGPTQEVFCATVPDTRAFVLPGYVLTGNCDINWNHNPFQRPRKTDMPAWMPLLWNRYGFAWGGNYGNNGTTGKADSMHYEFMGTPADADGMTALALRELRGGGPPIGNPGEDDPVTAIPIAVQANGTFRASAMAEAGASSVVVDRAWVTYGSTWGASHFVVTALDGGGRVMIQETFDIANNTGRAMALPSGCRLVTLEGTAAAGAVPAAALVNKNR